MASLNMNGPHQLDADTVNEVVESGRIGNYALGHNGNDNKFYVDYVGRSDTDVQSRLLRWVENSKRPLFKYSYAASAKDAFEKE